MITLADIERAREQVGGYVRRTPLAHNTTLSRELGGQVFLKMELFQKTGSFKPRGAFNQILNLAPERCERGVAAVSGGNFAQGLAYAGGALGVRTRICMPEYTPRNYVEATIGYGAEVELTPTMAGAFARAEELRQAGWNYAHPFDDPYQMAGAGVIGLELLEDVPGLTDVFLSIGGGGLISGVTTAIKALRPEVRIWGVETEGADAMGRALQAGRVVEFTPTSLARTLGAPYVAEDALRLMQEHLHRHVLVSEREAFEAQVHLLERAKLNTELAAACTLAAARKVKDELGPHSQTALVICGGNVSLEDLAGYRRLFREGEG